ncbi:MAG: hypothetical protein H6617_08155 [Bdellovibrionaceae bacterium]|nr:hypothetical protein [Bdellovibrionales bacterium]MCB9254638.1 hypothetical protein [Pseudobdellovibrionaceae bacterium]
MRNVSGKKLLVASLVAMSLAYMGCARRKAPLAPQLNIGPMPLPPITRPNPAQRIEKTKYLMVKRQEQLLEEEDILSVPMMVDREFTAEEREPNAEPQAEAALNAESVTIEPYRTFIEIQRYEIENNGEDPQAQPISNVKLEVKFPQDPADKEAPRLEMELPGNGQYWPIGNGQVQEIKRTLELPWKYIAKDGFTFEIQMVRKGSWMKPCVFEVTQLSEFNRAYVCRTDLDWQKKRGVPEERLDKEGVQIRVFTDKNTPKKQIPTDAIAIR